MPRQETLGERIRRLRQQRGLSLAKVSGEDFSRAFLNQVETGRSQPSTRVLRVIAGRLGTEVDYLLEGRPPNLDRELALERARILVARGQARRALSALAEAGDATDWQLRTDARLCQAEALRAIGSSEEADAIIAEERRVITAHRDAHRLDRLHALERGWLTGPCARPEAQMRWNTTGPLASCWRSSRYSCEFAGELQLNVGGVGAVVSDEITRLMTSCFANSIFVGSPVNSCGPFPSLAST